MKYFLETKYNYQKMSLSIQWYIFYFAHFQILGIVSMLEEGRYWLLNVKLNI